MDAAIGLRALSADLSYALIALHIAAALYSRVKGEGVWTSMIPVFTERGPPAPTRTSQTRKHGTCSAEKDGNVRGLKKEMRSAQAQP